MPVGKTESDVTDILDLALHAQMEPVFFLMYTPWKFCQMFAPESLPGPRRKPEKVFLCHHFSVACKLTTPYSPCFQTLKPSSPPLVDSKKLRALAFIISSSDMSQLLECPETWGLGMQGSDENWNEMDE